MKIKRTITILIIALFLLPVLQAQPKKVAILEPSGTFSIMQKAIFRAKVMESLINSGNYEAFYNTVIDNLTKEFNFQGNEMPNEAQRQQLKQICDAEWICITHTSCEEEQFFVEIHLVELVSGKIVTSTNQLIANKPLAEFEKGCIQLAVKLAWWSSTNPSVETSNTANFINGEVYNPDGIELVYVAVSDTDAVTSSFFIGMFEITQRQWQAIMGNNFSHFIGDSLPVENVSWPDVKEFLSKLNVVTGRNYRLPTEAEWEFAARGGTNRKNYRYSGSDNIDLVAWYDANSGNAIVKRTYENGKRMRRVENVNKCTHPVGLKLPNELGIYDMTGNVWEWCENKYKLFKNSRCVRGGSWYRDEEKGNLFFRAYDHPNVRSYNIGFRIMLDL